MQEQRSPIESQANTQNRPVACCPESRNGQDDRQVKEHFTKDSCLLNDCPQLGIRKGLLSNTEELFNPGEWLASNSTGGMTSVPPLLQAASLGGKEHRPPQVFVLRVTDSAVSPGICSQPILSGPQPHLEIDSKLSDTVHTSPLPVTQT